MKGGTAFFDPLTATASQLQDLLTAGKFTSTDLVEIYTNRIHQYDGYLKAILAVAPTAAKEARKLDEERSQGKFRGPLHGIPFIIKVSPLSVHTSAKTDRDNRIISLPVHC
jgi:amidase